MLTSKLLGVTWIILDNPYAIFVKLDLLDPWIKGQLKISDVYFLHLQNIPSCWIHGPLYMSQNLLTVGTKL